MKTLAIISIRAFSEIDLPESSQLHHRTFWKDMGDAIGYYVGLKPGKARRCSVIHLAHTQNTCGQFLDARC